MTRHKKIRPRTDIPDWRDPNMPLERTIRGITKQFAEERVRAFCANQLLDPAVPTFRTDPSYWWSKKRGN